MRGFERFARQAFEKIAGNRLFRRKTDGVYQAVQLWPYLAQLAEYGIDLRVIADVTLVYQVRAKFIGKFSDAVFEALADVGERQLCALAMAGLRNTVGNRAIR